MASTTCSRSPESRYDGTMLRFLVYLAFSMMLACARGPAAATAERDATASPLRPPVDDGPVGTAHPLYVQHASASGTYAAICQARQDTDGDGQIRVRTGHHGDLRGDRAELFLVVGSGAGEPIDALIDGDPDGRFVAATQKGRLVLYDTFRRTSEAVSALTPPEGRGNDYRIAAFDDSGAWLALLRKEGAGVRAVVRNLASKRETPLAPVPGEVHGVRFWGGHLVVSTLLRDTDGDGTLTWPKPRTNRAQGACVGPALSWSTYGYSGDRPDNFWVPLDGGTPMHLEPGGRPFGGGVLSSSDAGVLSLRTPGYPSAAAMAPASCDAEILVTDEASNQALVACRVEDRAPALCCTLAPVALAKDGVLQPLGFRVALDRRPEVHHLEGGSIVAFSSTDIGTDPPVSEPGAIVELPSGKVRLFEKMNVVAVSKETALLELYESPTRPGPRRLVLARAGSETVTQLSDASGLESDRYSPEFRAGELVSFRGRIWNLVSGAVVGEFPEGGAGLASNGRVLVVPDGLLGSFGPARWKPAAP